MPSFHQQSLKDACDGSGRLAFARAALVSLMVAGCVQAPTPEPALAEARLLMGTQVAMTAGGLPEVALRAAMDAAYAHMGRLSDEMNHYDPHSRVSAINHAAGQRPLPVSPDLMAVLQQAKALSARTGGAFDVTVGALSGWRFERDNPRLPTAREVRASRAKVGDRDLVLDPARGTAWLRRAGMRLDLGGIAKLYIVDAGLKVLRAQGVTRALIDAGGDIGVFGGTAARPWRIGIRAPRGEGLYARIEVTAGFVASSGDYERSFVIGGRRYHHLLDPRTGYPVSGLSQVTVVGGTLAEVNGMSAAVMVLGPSAGRQLVEDAQLAAILFDDAGTAWTTRALAPRLLPP